MNPNSRSDAGTSSKAAEPKSLQPLRAYPERNVVSEDKTYVKSMLGTIEEENRESVFDSTYIPEEYFAEIRPEERAKCQKETSSVMLAAVELCRIAQIMRAEDYSNLQRLITVTVLVLKFVRIMKSLLKRDTLSPDESTDQDTAVAKTLWIKEIQKSLSKNPKFDIWKKQFGIFTDHQGIMRCTGHLAKTELPTSIKHPILLEKDYHITSLIIEDSHKRVMHGGVKSTMTELGARFWIVQC